MLGICPHDTVWSGAQPEKFGNQKKKKTIRKLKYAPPYIKSFTATPSLLGPFDPKEGPPS